LNPQNRRRTVQGKAVSEGLKQHAGFISAQRLHQVLLEAREVISLATVYRNLNVLVSKGEADVVPTPTGGQLFRSCIDEHHHHHLICEKCGLAIEINQPSEGLIEELARSEGFCITRHVIEYFGICDACAQVP
jgi:Fur family ferric uptake transcriptional regulator